MNVTILPKYYPHMRTFLQYHVHGHFCPQMNVTISPKYYPHEDIFTISCPWTFLSSNEGDNFTQILSHMRTFLQYHVHGHFCPQMKRQFHPNIVHMKTFLQY